MGADTTEANPRVFDPDALREKYRIERDKRRRPDGTYQYREVPEDLHELMDDPWSDPIRRDPLVEEVEVLLIGAGHAGLVLAARLREVGIDDIRIIDSAGDFGGTWYWNRYPGAACDTEAYIYMPLLEELAYVPSEKYAKAAEIRGHCQAIARHYDLYPRALFQTRVEELRWDDGRARWVATTDRGDRISARFTVCANGPLNKPKLPGVPGVESFKGHTFHTSRWDYAYTGGDGNGNLTGLRDKVVGIIGTGATAIQCIPHLGASAKQLYVFQRTPSSVDVRGNRPTDPAWAASLGPGWQEERMANFTAVLAGHPVDEDLVNDGWTQLFHKLVGFLPPESDTGVSPEEHARVVELADFQKMEEIRARVDSIVEDKATADALKPWYRQFCKRPCFHDEYLHTYNRPNVTLVDTNGKGIDRVTERGVVANGVEYELDCLIYATGFEFGTSFTRRAGYEVYGRDGLALSEKWKNGVSTLFGMQTRGFPNLFFIMVSQVGLTANIVHLANEQSKHIAHIVEHTRKSGMDTAEPAAEAEADWVKRHLEASELTLPFFESCTPGYYNNEGDPHALVSRLNGPYAAGPVAFFSMLESWRVDGSLEGVELRSR